MQLFSNFFSTGFPSGAAPKGVKNKVGLLRPHQKNEHCLNPHNPARNSCKVRNLRF